MRLRRESELACDEFVIDTAGVPPSEYAAHLIALARSTVDRRVGWSGAMPMAQSSLLKRRVRIMLSSRHGRHALSPRKALALATVVAVLSLTLGSVRAAQDQGDLRGVVYDSTGAVVPEVEVTLSLSDEEKLVVYTSPDGSFSYPNVPAGTYTLSARLAGFAALTEEITLAAAPDWNRAITLELGTLRETISIVAERTAPAVTPTTTEPTRLRVGGNIRAPRKLKDVKPVYPPAMLAEGREGDVTLEAIIDGEGTVRSVRVLGALVHPDFALSAADAVKQWGPVAHAPQRRARRSGDDGVDVVPAVGMRSDRPSAGE